ncbi:MAG: type II toxin-antitoxin system VapC family toxin [Polyangia bacterium]
MIVVDTNLVVPLVIPGERTEIVERLLRCDPAWRAPPLLFSELRNVLLAYFRKGLATRAQCLSAIEAVRGLLDSRAEDEPDDSHVLRLAGDSGCTAYDCEFVAMAERLRCRLVTWDRQVLAAFGERAVTPEGICG